MTRTRNSSESGTADVTALPPDTAITGGTCTIGAVWNAQVRSAEHRGVHASKETLPPSSIFSKQEMSFQRAYSPFMKINKKCVVHCVSKGEPFLSYSLCWEKIFFPKGRALVAHTCTPSLNNAVSASFCLQALIVRLFFIFLIHKVCFRSGNRCCSQLSPPEKKVLFRHYTAIYYFSQVLNCAQRNPSAQNSSPHTKHRSVTTQTYLHFQNLLSHQPLITRSTLPSCLFQKLAPLHSSSKLFG